jgi:hypothetical protein
MLEASVWTDPSVGWPGANPFQPATFLTLTGDRDERNVSGVSRDSPADLMNLGVGTDGRPATNDHPAATSDFSMELLAISSL